VCDNVLKLSPRELACVIQSSGKRYQARDSKSTTSVKVIDMTGPKQRVLSSYEEIHDRHSRPDENLPTSGRHMYTLVLISYIYIPFRPTTFTYSNATCMGVGKGR
jgi:hypothetical protein